jgi:solute:Na+ symporter, SSS family
MRGADAVVLIAYFATMIAVGAGYSRHMKSAEMYFAGGKQLPWWIGGVSFVMSYVSALSIVVYAGLGYQYGFVALTLYWTTVPASVLTTWLLARRWRRAGIITPTEFLERRFSPLIRQLFVWSGVPLKIIDESLKIVAIGIFVSAGLRLPAEKAMLTVGLTILAYAVLGGLWAVVVTDFVQFVLVTGAILLLLPLTFHAAGGWHHLAMTVPKQFFAPAHPPYGWTYIGAFLVLSTLSLAGNWSLIQKFYSARSDDEAVRVGWLATIIFIVLPPVWIVTGMLARGYFTSGADPQSVYARLSSALLPAGMLGLIVAALFAATMSVLSSGYNVMSAVLTLDVYRRLLRPAADQRELVLVGRLLTAALALIVLALALTVTHFHWTIFDTMVAAFGFFLPPTVLPMLAGLLSRTLSAAGALAGFVAGIAIGVAFLFYRWFAHPQSAGSFQALSIVVPAALTAAVLVIASVFFPARGAEADRSTRFSIALTQASTATTASSFSPAPIAGLVIAVMGVVLILLGLISLMTHRGLNLQSLIMGGIFAVIGMAMIASSRLTKKQAVVEELHIESEALHHHGT